MNIMVGKNEQNSIEWPTEGTIEVYLETNILKTLTCSQRMQEDFRRGGVSEGLRLSETGTLLKDIISGLWGDHYAGTQGIRKKSQWLLSCGPAFISRRTG